MQIKLLVVSAAVFLISPSVNALGNSQGIVGSLTTNSDLVQSAVEMAQGHVGGLRRRKVNDLASGPRYGFPATEKKATKRSILNTLITPEVARKTTPQAQFDGYRDDEEGDDEERGGRHEAKREMKAQRRLLARADVKGLAIKSEMGANGILSSSQKLVADTQLSVNKMVGQVEHVADGAATSVLEHQSKKANDSQSNTTANVASAAATSDKKSTTGDAAATTTGTDSFKKAGTDDRSTNTATTKQSAPVAASQVDDDKLSSSSSSSPSTGSTEATDNMKINPQYLGSAGDNSQYGNPSDYNGNYFA